MNTRLPFLLLATVVLATALPSASVRSQFATTSSGDPLTDLQAIQTANDDLIKRQDATLKELTDLTETADQVRILSKRG